MGTKRAAVECRRYKRRPGRQGEEATRAWRRPASRRELRNTIARERGIAAYRAWVPFERIRPVNIPQEKWEETFAWPANNEPPYPPLAQRILRRLISYVAVILVAAVLLRLYSFSRANLACRADKKVDLIIDSAIPTRAFSAGHLA